MTKARVKEKAHRMKLIWQILLVKRKLVKQHRQRNWDTAASTYAHSVPSWPQYIPATRLNISMRFVEGSAVSLFLATNGKLYKQAPFRDYKRIHLQSAELDVLELLLKLLKAKLA
ncbi:hypothetical protein KBD87_02335 [Candidatus Saccharibacteria bacterium]|jgi:hypothetical protein|nr:hypothetical protein [Candidatus Saccharibacteria bacterium]